jgi:hypothetical protein
MKSPKKHAEIKPLKNITPQAVSQKAEELKTEPPLSEKDEIKLAEKKLGESQKKHH